jgi:hypothetical protein
MGAENMQNVITLVFAENASWKDTKMSLPKRLKEKQKILKKKALKRKKSGRPDFRIPIAPPSRRHKSKKDYKRDKRINYDD